MPNTLHNLPNIDAIFSLENFKFMDIKKVINIILENLGELNAKFDALDSKFTNLEVPDVSKLMAKISTLELNVMEGDKQRKQLSD